MTSLRARLKYVTRFDYGDALPTDEPQDGPFQVYGSNGPFSSFSRANTGAPAIIIGRKGSFGKVNWTPDRCFASDTTFVVDPSTCRYNLRWVFWLLQTLRLDEFTEEAAVPGLNREAAYNRPVLIPPESQQQVIADYLDRETARLDALIAAKERLLGLLAEKRRALITRAVTRGLDPNAPLRDSGIPWLGPIPAHWDTRKFTRAVILAEGQVDPEVEPYASMPLVAPDHVESGTGRLLRLISASEQGASSGKYLCHPGDVIYSKIRPALRKVTLAPCSCLCSADMYPMRVLDGLTPEYLKMYLLAEPFSTWAILESARVAMPKINREALIEVRIPVPPYQEQEAIAEHIARQTARLEAVHVAGERTLSLLKERRAALIAAAVTGQIPIPLESIP